MEFGPFPPPFQSSQPILTDTFPFFCCGAVRGSMERPFLCIFLSSQIPKKMKRNSFSFLSFYVCQDPHFPPLLRSLAAQALVFLAFERNASPSFPFFKLPHSRAAILAFVKKFFPFLDREKPLLPRDALQYFPLRGYSSSLNVKDFSSRSDVL